MAQLDVSQAIIMKLIDGLELKGRPAEIPDCSRDDLPQFFVDMGFTVGAEIGVDKGEFSEKIAQTGVKLFSVDPWKYDDDYVDRHSQDRLDSFYESTKQRLSKYPNATVIRKTSMEAVNDFPDNSLDFVYLDGNHQLKYIIEDLCEWSKKVKVGGIISGHDYIYTNPKTMAAICHVIYAVNAFTSAYNIRNWYILGRKENREGERRDSWRSWMWIKPEFKLRT
jgi:hypothetical protein